MNHLLQERYLGSAEENLVMGQFIKGEECVISAGCDRIVLYKIAEGRLVKIKEKRVFGCILGLAVVPSLGEEADSLLVHFEYARVSAIFFREDQNEFVCRSLRFYEKQQYGFVHGSEKNTSFIRVDEEHGVSFLLISNTHFAIFSSSAVGESKVFEMQKIRPRHCAIKDVAFLKGYSSASLCFLFEDTVAERSRILVYILNVEYELSFFFEVDSVPHGCYQLVPTQDKAFMVLGACGALFYTQWEMLGVRFNDFWSFDRLGIEERPLKEKNFVVENGKCLVKDRDIFLISETIFLQFTILGGNSRVSSVIVRKIDLDAKFNKPYSTAVYGNRGCFSTAEGLFLLTFESETIMEEKEQKPIDVVTEEYVQMFLSDATDSDLPPASADRESASAGEQERLSVSPKKTRAKKQKSTDNNHLHKESEDGLLSGRILEREYEKMFRMAGDTEKKNEEEVKETKTNKIVITQTKPSIGEICCIEPLPLIEKQQVFLVAAGSPGQPLLFEAKEGMDLLYTHTAKIRGYSDLFVVDALENKYLLTKEGESAVVHWDKEVDLVQSEISNSLTILFHAISTGYIQVTVSHICYLDKELKKVKTAVLPETARAAVYEDDKVFLITETGAAYQYKGNRKTKIPVPDATAITVHKGTLYIVDKSGRLSVYCIASRKIRGEYSLLSVFPSVLESVEIEMDAKYKLAIHDITAVEYMLATYLLVRTVNNEVIVYRQKDSRFFKETVANNAFYHEKHESAHKALSRIQVCGDLVFIPGCNQTRVLCFTPYTLIMHRYNMPIDSISEIASPEESQYRYFIIMAKGNIVRGTLPDYYSYDKPIFYRKTKVDSICQHIAYSACKKVIVASVYVEKAYTQEMIPFTVQATTELDADPVPLPAIPDISVNPLTRAYSLKIYSHDEMRQYSRSSAVLTSVDEYMLEDNEYISCHRIVTLPDKQNTEGCSEFVIVCTTYITDEDLMARGRLIVLEIASVVPKRDRIETRHKLKALAAEKTKGAATACDVIKGNIVVCIGTKLMIYVFDRNEGLKAVAFHDIHVFLTSCMVLRNIIVCGDAYKGTFLLFYQSEPPLLHMLSQSSGGVNLLKGVGMTLYGTSLSLLSYDSSNIVTIYSYSPQHILSQAGSRLISRGECKLPAPIAGSFRIELGGIYRTGLYTKNGYVYTHKTLDQSKYVSLLDLQHAVESNLWMTLGTNSKSHWLTDKPAEMKEITLKEVLQTGLMEEYFSMCNVRANRISAETGRSSSGAVKDELEFYRVAP
ncbi:cleavage and polyadenylation specificity factor subunit 1 [Nematocida minor]|uniref:cleavage and polyadenylation specificity factor subunit 1 n=1 Tax=Nematocida minor TaxID=1912983 RepID=UPI00221FAE95|nr:cleavage and polyadenylation specificity factor subunit 1 [Nematocida minor]KAI5190230.1 cleavage and polyadenylation specificity factor subunit 1 [Nematocida minor]